MKIWLLLLFPLTLFGNPIPVVVVGSGPAGLSAALVTSRDRVETQIFQGPKMGGPANAKTCLGNWPASVPGKGDALLQRLIDQVKELGALFRDESIVSVDFSSWPYALTTSRGEVVYAKAVILAPGSHQKRLGLPGEELYFGKGIDSYFYKTDEAKAEGRKVVVVGGGIDAVKKACAAAKRAERVYLVVRKGALQAPYLAHKVKKKGGGKIEVLYHTTVSQIRGNGERITHIALNQEGGSFEVEVDLLLLGIGIAPSTSFLNGQLPLDTEGYLELEGRTQKTSISGVFAAGSATDPRYRQAAISSGDGMKAGYDALEFLSQY